MKAGMKLAGWQVAFNEMLGELSVAREREIMSQTEYRASFAADDHGRDGRFHRPRDQTAVGGGGGQLTRRYTLAHKRGARSWRSASRAGKHW